MLRSLEKYGRARVQVRVRQAELARAQQKLERAQQDVSAQCRKRKLDDTSEEACERYRARWQTRAHIKEFVTTLMVAPQSYEAWEWVADENYDAYENYDAFTCAAPDDHCWWAANPDRRCEFAGYFCSMWNVKYQICLRCFHSGCDTALLAAHEKEAWKARTGCTDEWAIHVAHGESGGESGASIRARFLAPPEHKQWLRVRQPDEWPHRCCAPSCGENVCYALLGQPHLALCTEHFDRREAVASDENFVIVAFEHRNKGH